MKKVLYKLSIIVLIIASGACSDFLDEPIQGYQIADTYFQTEEECENFLTGCYQGMFQNDWWMIQMFHVLAESATDDAWLSNPTQAELDYRDFSRYMANTTNEYLSNFWEYNYKNIYQCNMALENFASSPVKELNAAFIHRVTAEAKFIRAYAYFELVKNFKELPLLTRIYKQEELENFPIASQQQIFQQIESDLKAAAAVLPIKSQMEIGRVNKGVAWAYLARMYTYTENWIMAKTYADSVIEQAGYSLEPAFGNIWDINNKNGVESIFEVQTNENAMYENGNSLPIITGGREDHGWYYAAPTSNLENAYLAQNDIVRMRATIIKANNETTAISDNVGYAEVYDTDGTTVIDNISVAQLRDSKSMRVNRKFFIPHKDRLSNYGHNERNHIPKNHILMRLAEVKLIRAEAMWHMIHTTGEANFGEGDIIGGDIHDIRNRVGLADIASSGDELLLDIYQERRLEMAMEMRRWDEIRRAKHPSDGMPLVYHIMGANGSFVKYNVEQNVDWWEVQSPYASREATDKGIDFAPGAEWLPTPAHDLVWLNN